MNFKLREASLGDLKEIQKLNQELFLHDFAYDSTINNDWPFSKDGEKYFKKTITSRKYITLVATAEKQIIGYLVGVVWNKWPSRPVKTAELDNMLISKEYRQKGIGTMLIEEFLGRCKKRGVKSVFVMAYHKNKEAIDFYQGKGFADLSERLERKL